MSPLAAVLLAGCLLQYPVSGPVVRPFAPQGEYGGHWGIDLAVPEGTPVGAAGGGEVTFAGPVAGRLSVTVHHGGGVRTSYSYLSAIAVHPGEAVVSGTSLGRSGTDHGLPAVHFSMRVGSVYVDPAVACAITAPWRALRLMVGSFAFSRK
jgi:murein DD-endopeptidase MepM/ murein hydrolase activator NlpD